MKLLLDEMMATELGPELSGHQVSHSIELGWRNITNGKLLDKAEENGFDVLITTDGNMPHQQNMRSRNIAALILRPRAQSLPALLELAPRILIVLSQIQKGTVEVLNG